MFLTQRAPAGLGDGLSFGMRRLGCAAFLWILSALTVQPAQAQATVNVRIVVAPSSRLGFAQAPGTTGADRAEVAARSAAATRLDASGAAAMSMTAAKRSDVDSEALLVDRRETAASTSLCAASQPRWAVATGSAAQLTVSRRLPRTSETGTPQPARPIVLCTLIAP